MDISWMIMTALCAVPLLAVMTYVLWREECESLSGEDAIADWPRAREAQTQAQAQAQAKPRVTVLNKASDRALEYA